MNADAVVRPGGRALLVLSMLITATARADVEYGFVLDGSQVVPSSGSLAQGQALAILNAAETQIQFIIQHGADDPVSATVHNGTFGINGPVVFSFEPENATSNAFSETWTVSPTVVSELQAGNLYVQIDTLENPGGEIRGQIDVNRDPQPGDVIITEIMYDPASAEDLPSAAPEWIELFNTTFTDIDISGWFLQDEDVVDPNGDPCTLRRSGSMPGFILRSFKTVVVIPDGSPGQQPTVADFRAAWGLDPSAPVIQLNPDGTADGAIVGGTLSNDPESDGFVQNDLPLVNSLFLPCGSNGIARPDDEILTLFGNNQIIDSVNFDDIAPWPTPTGESSITLVPTDFPEYTDYRSYTATGNDEGANWRSHTLGDAAGGFRQVASAGVYGGQDIGSPCYLRGATRGNQPPVAIPQVVLTGPGASGEITLLATDQTRPFFGLVIFYITQLPQLGQLIDVGANHVVTEADLNPSPGYLMGRPPFNLVRYENAGTCGLDSFKIMASDGLSYSEEVSVELIVQCGDIAITEIMYDPASTEGIPPLTEWVEIFNTRETPIDLSGWHLASTSGRGGDMPPYILGGRSAVTVIPPVTDAAEFTAAWSAPFIQLTTNGATALGVAGAGLNNGGDDLSLLMPPVGGEQAKVSDAVFFVDGFSDPETDWPKLPVGGPSIYANDLHFDALENDVADYWDASTNGRAGAFINVQTTIYDGLDQGSPGILEDVLQGSCSQAATPFDGNGDDLLNFSDLSHFVLCTRGPNADPPLNCLCFDAEADGDIDLRDFSALQIVFPAP